MNTVFTAFEHEKKTSFGSFEVITRGGSKTPEKTAGVYEHGKPHGVKGEKPDKEAYTIFGWSAFTSSNASPYFANFPGI